MIPSTRKRFFLFLQKSLQIDAYDALKLILSAFIFFFIIGSYSILRSLKTSIFLGFVGREYEPIAKIAGIIITIPAMMLHAKIIDTFKKHQIVLVFLGFYAALTLMFSLLFAHPVYGVANTQTSPYRITGWTFEVFMDLFQALVVGTFWGFINSICTPQLAERGYGLIVAGSRIGGILTPLLSWLLLEKTDLASSTTLPLLTAGASILLLLGIYCIYVLKRLIPSSHMLGYEAAYTSETQGKQQDKSGHMFEGLKLMITEPYVLGIFCLVFSYEVINIIFDYQMHVLMSIETNNNIADMSKFMLIYTCTFQVLSFLFAIFGVTTIIKRLGVPHALLVMPIITMALAFFPVFYPKLLTIFIVMVILRAFNYGFNHPLREMLFIPTTKDIRFKSKAWIESFGRTFSKTTGSTLNMIAISSAPYFCILLESCFSFFLAVIWSIVALAIGKRYIQTIAKNDVIGKDR